MHYFHWPKKNNHLSDKVIVRSTVLKPEKHKRILRWKMFKSWYSTQILAQTCREMELASQLPVEEGRGAGRGEERKMCPDFMFMSFLEPGRELKFQGKHLTWVFSISLAYFYLLCQACPSTLESNLVLSEVCQFIYSFGFFHIFTINLFNKHI